MACVGSIVSGATRPAGASSPVDSPHQRDAHHQWKTPTPAASRGDRWRLFLIIIPWPFLRLGQIIEAQFLGGHQIWGQCSTPQQPWESAIAQTSADGSQWQSMAANGCSIYTYGKRKIKLKLGVEHSEWTVDIADVQRPLLGADFLQATVLLVDVRQQRLVNPKSLHSVPLQPAKLSTVHLVRADRSKYDQLLSRFPSLTAPMFSTAKVKHGTCHHIIMQGPPVTARAQHLPPDKLAISRAEFKWMADMGIICRSASQYFSLLHLVDKSDGRKPPCGDFRRLNEATVPDRYPVPHIQDFLANLASRRIFSEVDLVRGYYQVPMAPEDIPKMAIITPFGLWEFTRMPFGLKNAVQTFQRLMDTVCLDLDFAFVILDDILVASATEDEHYDHLMKLFECLGANYLAINPAKCVFGEPSLNFLGHFVDRHGIRVSIQSPPKWMPSNSFRSQHLWHNYASLWVWLTHRFIPKAAELMQPLYSSLASRPRERDFTFSSTMASVFKCTKEALAAAIMLVHPDPNSMISITTDASDEAVGAVLQQETNKGWQPLASFSQRLHPSEKNYSAFNCKLLALYLSILHFHYFLEGRSFMAYTGHKTLMFALVKVSQPWSARQQCYLAPVSEFTTDIRHVSGKDNTVADALSWVTVTRFNKELDFAAMAQTQCSNPEIHAYQTAITNLGFEDVSVDNSPFTLLCDVSTGQRQPVVPASWQHPVFEAIHNLSHLGIRTTCRLVSKKFVWRGMTKQVKVWTKECLACQRSKIQRHTWAPLAQFEAPAKRFNQIHVDLVGPLPSSQSFTHLLTIVDCFTRWPATIPLQATDTMTWARALTRDWISQFGVPSDISLYSGVQFISRLVVHWWHRTASHHGLPSTDQWSSWEIPQTHEVFASFPAYNCSLDGRVALGDFRHTDCTKGRLKLIVRWNGVWSAPYGPSRFFRPTGPTTNTW